MTLIARLLAEGRIRQDHVIAFAGIGCQGVARADRALAIADAVQVEVHAAEPHHLVHDVHAAQRVLAQLPLLRRGPATGPSCGHRRRAGSRRCRTPGHARFRRCAGSITSTIALDQRARREVLARAGLHFAGVLFQQPLVDRTLHVDANADPGLVVDQRDDPLELGRVGELVLRLAEDGADQALLFGEAFERMPVLKFEGIPRERRQLIPAPLGRE